MFLTLLREIGIPNKYIYQDDERNCICIKRFIKDFNIFVWDNFVKYLNNNIKYFLEILTIQFNK